MKTPKQSKRMKLPNGFGSIVKCTDKRGFTHRTSQSYRARRGKIAG